ncbi:hypothetical protein [Novosphingobium sp. FKTRR1]|uniref:hypothetical protein n=1 Tax=Novosphingobium sp. FKTRR1 TaxID=2879118 RepID=UPI001CF07FC4|nr:hypothetical protein [Novosphingobium sp. FKTRR1]
MLRFAPRYGIVSPCLVRPTRGWQLRAVNDNANRRAAPAHWTGDDAMLEAALRLFGSHGLSAAAHAAASADSAQAAGDFEKARWWIGVSRLLDGRARRVQR